EEAQGGVALGVGAAERTAQPLFGVLAQHQTPADQRVSVVHGSMPRTPYLSHASNSFDSSASARAATSTLTVSAAISGSLVSPSPSRKVSARWCFSRGVK